MRRRESGYRRDVRSALTLQRSLAWCCRSSAEPECMRRLTWPMPPDAPATTVHGLSALLQILTNSALLTSFHGDLEESSSGRFGTGITNRLSDWSRRETDLKASELKGFVLWENVSMRPLRWSFKNKSLARKVGSNEGLEGPCDVA